MSWIKTIKYEQAEGRLRELYKRVKGPDNNVDNIMMVHSLRPHTLEGHMAIYKYVLHHASNKVPKWFLETLGVYVSQLNACAYCVEHHFAGLQRLLRDDERADALRAALEAEDFYGSAFSEAQRAALEYAKTLTTNPAALDESVIVKMQACGWDDGEILEINQVCAYFAYANRTVLGLGVSTNGDIMGLSPGNSDDPDDWSHQ